MSIVIGVTGEIGSGKTTVCNYICEQYKFEEYAFAHPLKSIAKCFGFTHKELYGTQKEKLQPNEHWGISGRVFMQKFGTEICRNALPEVMPEMKLNESDSLWIKLYKIHKAKKIKRNKKSRIVVSDVRFVDESSAIQEDKGIIIRIIRTVDDAKGDIHNHSSEKEMKSIHPDITIINDGTLADLYKKIDYELNVIMLSCNLEAM